MAYRDVILADSPVDYYEMETDTGTDSGSGSRTLTLSGGITTGASGKLGNGWTFDGVNDTASMATWPTLTNAFTFEAWVKPNLSGVNDTPTVIRRDGTDIMLLRVRGSSVPVNPGQAEVYADGLTLLSGSAYRVDDGNWHHLVYTQSGNTARLYVDGVQRATGTTSQSTFNMGTGTGYIGSANGTTEWYKGTMDEVAIYNTALTATKVLDHYNAATVNAGYTAQVMTASATTTDATGGGNVRSILITEDANTNSASPNTNNATATFITASATQAAYFKIPAPSLTAGEAITGATLRLDRSGDSNAATVSVYRVTSDWTESGLTHNAQPTYELVKTVSVPAGLSTSSFSIDISDVLSFTNYGVRLSSTSALSIVSAENVAGAPYDQPVVIYTIAPMASAAVVADVLTASASMPDATVAATDTVSVGTNPLTASASMPNASVSVTSFLEVDAHAEPMQAQAAWPTATGFVLPVSIAAEPITADATSLDAAAETQRGPKIAADPMKATAVWKQPASVNGVAITASEVDDKFFQRVWAAVPHRWYRLNDAGSEAVDRMAPTGRKGYYLGVQTGQFNGPDGRHSVYFDGSAYLRQDEGPTNESGPGTTTLEFSFRTTKANQFIMVSADDRSGVVGNQALSAREVFMSDGRIGFRTYNGTNASEFVGFRNLADGQWHTVVIRSYRGAVQNDITDGIEIYIDGKFEIRRWNAGPLVGFPDYIGLRPTIMNAGTTSSYTLPALPASQNFVGDMSEVVFFHRLLDEYEITRHYYDFMGWTPVEATAMEAFAFTPAEHRGRGNQKRALYLWWDNQHDFLRNDLSHDPVLDGRGVHGGVYDLEGYKVFTRAVVRDYRDPVYDLPSLIDLDHDVDVDEFDVIMFADWPDEGSEEDTFTARIPRFAAEKQRLIDQLREANSRGVGLLVTHPRMAVDLGIVDRVEWVPTLAEAKSSPLQGNAIGLYDYGSAVKFPWDISVDAGLGNLASGVGGTGTGMAMNTSPTFLASKAFYYEDMNFVNKFRVRALVEGLTDIPSFMIQDAVYHVDRDVWGDTVSALNLMDRRSGLQIGDEFIFHGTNPAHMDWGSWDLDGARTGRPTGYYATPMANVKAGTVVTTFGATHWKEQSQTSNPYRDYATTIVLDRGDVLAGKAVGGRIFVSFTEQPNRFNLSLPANVLPGSEWDDGSATWPNNYNPDTAAQRDWEFSETRISVGNTSLGGSLIETTVTMPDGSTMVTRGTSSGGLIYANYTNLFSVAALPRWDMTRRGMWWVSRGERPQPGEKRVAAAPITATAAMPDATVVAQRDNTYAAEPMRALAQMTRVAESTIGDVTITTLPATAYAQFTGFSRVISAAPMTAEAELVENFDMVHASGEQVVLTLHGVDATLYLKEEA